MMWRLAILLVFMAGHAMAQAPGLGAPAGAERTHFAERDYDEYAMPTGPIRPGWEIAETLAGQVVRVAYRLDDPAATSAAVIEKYLARLHAEGFERIYQCASEECGGFDFRFGAEVLPPPAMLLDVADFRQLSMHDPERNIYASILVSALQGRVYIQTVRVVASDPPTAETVGKIPDEQTQSAALPVAEQALAARLIAEGHVPVDGLEFETGGAKLSAASDEALDRLAAVLSEDSALSVVIVGHSDNVGDLDANIELSRRRADAVRSALIGRGVPDAQLAARGVGYLAPVTSNATDEGKARNRRVELVLRAVP